MLLVDSVAAIAGGAAGISSNTSYIESAAGVAEGGRTGFASVVTGVLFLAAIFLAPIAGIIPAQATAPALVLVGYLMFTQLRDIPVSDVDEGLPALLTMILMPLTYNITVGIGAGFITWVLIKVVRGRAGEVHPLMWVVCARVRRVLPAGLDRLGDLSGPAGGPASGRRGGRPLSGALGGRRSPDRRSDGLRRVPFGRCSNGLRCPRGRA